MPWRVPGRESIVSSSFVPMIETQSLLVVVFVLSLVVTRAPQIQAVATIFLGSSLLFLGSIECRYVRTSAALAAASLGEDSFGACELDPNVRPPEGADVLLLVPVCLGRAAGVEPTV